MIYGDKGHRDKGHRVNTNCMLLWIAILENDARKIFLATADCSTDCRVNAKTARKQLETSSREWQAM